MKNSQLTLFIVLTMLSLTSTAQNLKIDFKIDSAQISDDFISLQLQTVQKLKIDSVQITKGEVVYCVGDNDIFNVYYKIKNNTNKPLWLWIEKDIDNSTFSYFYNARGGNLDLCHILTDANMNISEPYISQIFTTFLKRVEPKEEFIFQVVSNKKTTRISREKILKYFENHVVILTEEEIPSHAQWLKKPINKRILYKENFITFFIDSLSWK